MRYRPAEVSVNPENPFKNDNLDRQPFVGAMTELLKAIQEPFVIALNAPWGSGKTTTLRLLEPNLKAAGITTVSFNAWEVDDAIDPLVPLVSTLRDRILEIKGYDAKGEDIDRFKKLGSKIAKHGAIAIVKIATAGVVDASPVLDGIAKAASEAAQKGGEDLAGDLIDAYKKERQAGQDFKKLLEELTAYLRNVAEEKTDVPPLVLMIDELDRCRPTFAIAMLERIKHFFNVPGLVFVLALDLDQLKVSTRKVYGNELDAVEYLRRFIDLDLRLPRAEVSNMVDAMLTNCGADTFFAARSNPEVQKDRQWIVRTLSTLAAHFELSLRLVQRMVSRLMLVLRQTRENESFSPITVVFMIFMRVWDEKLLKELVAARLQVNDLMESLRSISPDGQKFYESAVGIEIEAHLLYAHEQHNYVQSILQQAERVAATGLDDAKSRRAKKVARRYESIRSVSFRFGTLNLKRIDQRINLVAADLKEE